MRRTIDRTIPWTERKDFTSVFSASQLVRGYHRVALAESLLWKFWNCGGMWS